MKKLFLLVGLLICGIGVLKAQVGGIVYQPFVYGQTQSQNQQQAQSQTSRTTAYYVSYGDVYKVPIMITTDNSGAYVSAYYKDNGFGGNWQTLPYPARISKCNSAWAGDNSLESSFMYKAMVNMEWYYFDL